MAHALPFLRNTSGTLNCQVLFPFERGLSFLTQVTTGFNGSEQRNPTRPPLTDFSLPMSNLMTADKAAWLTFFNTVQGRRLTDLQITLVNPVMSTTTVYSNLTLMSDDLNQTNPHDVLYNQQVTLRQVSNSAWTPASAPTTYPTFSFGTVAEQPYTQVYSFLTSVNDNIYGPRFDYEWYGTGLTNFPTGNLLAWRISYPLLQDSDAATLEAFFNAAQGKFYTFSFTDPIGGTTYSNVRFDSDSLRFRYITRNQSSTEVTLRQVFV